MTRRYWYVRVTYTPANPDRDRKRAARRFWSAAEPYSLELVRDALTALDRLDLIEHMDPGDVIGDGADACHAIALPWHGDYHFAIRPALTPKQCAAREAACHTWTPRPIEPKPSTPTLDDSGLFAGFEPALTAKPG